MKTIEEVVFQGKQVNWTSLETFGFVLEEGKHVYRSSLMKGQFEVVIRLEQEGRVAGQIIDKDLGEEYTAFRLPRVTGAFVGEVRESYQELLEQIAVACFNTVGLSSPQGQALVHRIREDFGDKGAQPFEKFPDIYAFRNPVNDKWYALALTIERKKLDLRQEVWSKEQKEEKVEVLNVKVVPEQVERLTQKRGIYPSYHMNKKHWVTVVLDGSLSDEDTWDLVVTSRGLVAGKSRKGSSQLEWWVIPANPKLYDIDADFARSPIMDWPQKASIQAGDFVVIYMTAPIRALRYLCAVEEGIMPKQMRLRLLAVFGDAEFPIAFLQEKGLKTVRGPRRLPDELVKVLQKKINS
ncbi:MmcQ/YjbR family DNA-binding protein [Streptococcus cameli]